MRHLLVLALICAVAVATVMVYAPDLREAARKPSKPTVAGLERTIEDLEGQVSTLEQTADRYAEWKTCVTWVPVTEVGDPDNRFGYNYDERDGTGLTFAPALAVDSEDQTSDYVFLKFDRRDGCQSQPVQPGGTAEEASVDASDTTESALVSSQARAPSEAQVRALERRVEKLTERAEALRRMSERFDEWESCLSWVPVTEFGDADNRFGYLFDEGESEPGYRPAIAVDRSERDDPDYQFLAFAGSDRPFTDRECEGEPRESVD